MTTQFEIEDFAKSSLPVIKANYKLFEIAQIIENTMAHGKVLLPDSKIVFEQLELNSFPMQVFERLRMWSSPQLKETKLGKLLVWDNYALRIKSQPMKNGVVYENPEVILHYQADHSKAYYFNSFDEAKKFADEITALGRWQS